MGRAYLGTGVKYPITVRKGRVTVASDVDLINQSIEIILNTPVNTRMFIPEFGSRLKELLFEENDTILSDLLKLFITEAISNFEKRIKVIDVIPEIDGDTVLCTILYRVLNSNEVESMIYPFYRQKKYK